MNTNRFAIAVALVLLGLVAVLLWGAAGSPDGVKAAGMPAGLAGTIGSAGSEINPASLEVQSQERALPPTSSMSPTLQGPGVVGSDASAGGQRDGSVDDLTATAPIRDSLVFTSTYLPIVQRNDQSLPPVNPPINKIVYASGWTVDSPRCGIYVMNPDGTGQTRLAYSGSSSYETPTWSPDGTKIAFTSSTPTGGDEYLNEILIMNADGTGIARLIDIPGHHFHATWSSDGTKIAFSSDLHYPGVYTPNDIYVVNSDSSGTPTNLTNTPDHHDDDPSWSPDGNKIAYVSWFGDNAEILLMNADGTGRANLTNSPYGDFAPSWSPDGQRIAFYRRLGSDGDWSRQIFVMNADGTGQVQLTANWGQNWYPTWSADGSKIAFQTYYEDYADIYVMNADGTGVVNITNHQYAYASIQPDWR